MGRSPETLYIPTYINEEIARRELDFDVRSFPWTYLRNNSERVIDRQLALLFEDLQSGRFWGVLQMTDGYNGPYEKNFQRLDAQAWARGKFTERELNQIFEICVQTAFYPPKDSAWPGSYHGHSILYRDLVEVPGSIFANKVDQDFKNRLVNGSFWENIPDMCGNINSGIHLRHVEELLRTKYHLLDPKFAPEGIKILERGNWVQPPHFDYEELTSAGKKRYRKFIRNCSEYLSQEHVSFLLAPDTILYPNALANAS